MSNRAMAKQAADRFIIQIERPDEKVDMNLARALLEPLGVILDPAYGPVCVSRKLGRYVVRGSATEEAKSQAERLNGIRFFSDVKVKPLRS